MSRPRPLADVKQPIFVRCVLATYEFFASLKLAVILIFSLACLLGMATFVEANYGTAAVGFLIYHTWFFSALLVLLALNIFCAASIRYPWKRHQTGFVITHIGLLTLLAGSAISDRGSVNSQMLVYLGDSNHVAIDMDQSILTVANIPGRTEPLQVRFHPGPFNWSDLAPYPIVRRIESWFSWSDVSSHDTTLSWKHAPQALFDDGKSKVEVVDYYARSESRRTPFLALKLLQPALKFEIPIDLEMGGEQGDSSFARAPVGPMGEVMMWKSDEADALRAFKECKPDRTVDGLGVVAMWWKGEVYTASVKELQKLKDQKKRFELDHGLSIELGGYAESADVRSLMQGKGLVPQAADPDASGAAERGVGPTVELLLHDKSGSAETSWRLLRFAELPFLPEGKHPPGFHAAYFHPQVKGRIDILIGPDEKLAFRAWQQKVGRVVASGDLEIDKPVDTWSMGGGQNVMRMTAVRYVPHSEQSGGPANNEAILPLPFDKGDHGESKRVQMRISWTDSKTHDPKAETFWLKQNLPEPWESHRRQQVHETQVGLAQPIRTSYNVKQTDTGFALKLLDFDLEVDPGTKMAANYTSHVIQVDVRDNPDVLRLRERIREARDEDRQELREELARTLLKRTESRLEALQGKSPDEQQQAASNDPELADLVITMNRPLDYPDLEGRQLRFFQENYIPPNKAQSTPLASVFRVNYDPGRPVKYLGCGLIVFGIFLMFYMRAYFFKRPASGTVS